MKAAEPNVIGWLEPSASLESRVLRYLAQTDVSLHTVKVSADEGRVRLSGTLSSRYLRKLAVAAAQRVAGVLYVQDEILLNPAASCSIECQAVPA